MKETDVAQKIAEHLRSMKWEVYSEVQMRYGGIRADLVATQHPQVWVIETKTRLSFGVIEQAIRWTPYAHRVSIGVPAVKSRTASRRVADLVLPRLGIGLVEVEDREWLPEEDAKYTHSRRRLPVRERITPKLRRKPGAKHLRECLREEHKTFADPGNADSEYWTPFKATVQELQDFVERNPGCTMKELVEGVDHHYRTPDSAKGCIPRYIRRGIIEGLEIRKESGRLYFYPA